MLFAPLFLLLPLLRVAFRLFGWRLDNVWCKSTVHAVTRPVDSPGDQEEETARCISCVAVTVFNCEQRTFVFDVLKFPHRES